MSAHNLLRRALLGLGLGLSFALVGSPAWAESPVWKVSKGENHLYIGGTIHVLTQAD